MWLCRKTANIYVKTEHFTLCVKDDDTTTTANIKIVVLQYWHIFIRTRAFAKFYSKGKIVRTCDFFHYLMTIRPYIHTAVSELHARPRVFDSYHCHEHWTSFSQWPIVLQAKDPDEVRWTCFQLFRTCFVKHAPYPPADNYTSANTFKRLLLIDWLTALRHINTERLLVSRNGAKYDMIKIRR